MRQPQRQNTGALCIDIRLIFQSEWLPILRRVHLIMPADDKRSGRPPVGGRLTRRRHTGQ